MAAPETELGHPGGLIPEGDKAGSFVVAPLDPNVDLHFPLSVAVYDQMRRTDTAVGSMLRSVVLPIVGADWQLGGADVEPRVLDAVRAELGITEPGGQRQRRRRHGIVLKEHVKEALLMLPLGFMPFEQVYEPGPPIPGQEGSGLSTLLHIRKLAPRLPRTLTQIHVARDGGLAGISQAPLTGDKDIFIPVDNLVFYVLDKEGADWTGTSILRTAYKDYLIKDKLTRVGAQTVERNGMGIPVIYYPKDDAEAKTAAETNGRNLRAGATASLAVPEGSKVEMMGVTGSTVDALPWIEKMDRNIAEAGLAMFKTLGHDNGARSLGETLYDVFLASLQAVADLIAETITEHVIRDFVELNFGEDAAYPVLTPGDLSTNRKVNAEALKMLVDAGLITPDEKTETMLRAQQGLPAAEAKGVMSATEMAKRGEYLGTLIRSGYDPTEALEQAGLDPIKHLGLVPITLQRAAASGLDGALPSGGTQLSEGTHLDKATILLERVAKIRREHV